MIRNRLVDRSAGRRLDTSRRRSPLGLAVDRLTESEAPGRRSALAAHRLTGSHAPCHRSALAVDRLMGSQAPGRRSALAVAVGLVLTAAASSGCLFSPPASLTTTAYFADVSNLVTGAPVQMAGITIGDVTSISLDSSDAKVVMSVAKNAHVPANVTAEVEQSTVLGQEVVELVPPAHSTVTVLLSNNSTIRNTTLVPGIEQFVGASTSVLGAISTSQLAQLVNAGGQGLGGEAATLKSLIVDLNTVTAGYASRSSEIRTLVANMNQLSGSLAGHASSDAQAITELAHTVTILSQQSQQFVSLLGNLNSLSEQGQSLLRAEFRQINLQFSGLAGISSTLAGQQQAISQLLEYLPGHDAVLHAVAVDRFAQVVDAIILCGLPDGGGNTTQAASSCHGADGSGG